MIQRTSRQIMAEHNELLNKKMTAIMDATRNAQNKYDPKLKQLMAEYIVARATEVVEDAMRGTPPDEYSKPIDKSGCAK